jgi:hypothetical protein
VTVQSWQDGLRFLRGFPDVADAQAQAVVVARASGRWSRAVVARVGRYQTVFTRPGDEPPFTQTVTLEILGGGRVTLAWVGERSHERRTTDLDHVDGLLAAFLERLTSPVLTCTECGNQVLVSAKWFETFERMHWTCFHYVFEHGDLDRDEECIAGGCPSAAVEPWHVLNDPRDALVGQLLDDLRTGTLAEESGEVRIEREAPGVVSARFDEARYLVTVRRIPERR